MDDKRAIANVVDKETGEIVNDLYPGDKIVRAESKKSYKKYTNSKKETPEYEKWDLDNFYRANISELSLLMKELSQTEKAFLFSISPYVSFEDSHLQYRNGVDIGTEDLVKITGMSRATVYRTIDDLISKDVLYKGKNSRSRQYFVNPWLFSKGNRINKVLKTMFKNYKIRMLDNVRWKDL